ncbi:MAG TPA: SurA N-terminal domain-containing protein [Blastocatellia bacterium]|nr:SurA N-terminal domain-containing protein [Blastocatellia bacterium]
MGFLRSKKTVRKILLPTIVLSLSFLVSSCGEANSSAGAGGGNEVAATVNSVNILIKDVDRVLAQQVGGQDGQLSQLSQIEQAAARIQALDSLITQEALYQQAQKENIVPSEDEIKRFIQNYKVERALTEEAFAAELKKTNQTEDQFREFVKKQLSINKLYEKAQTQLKVQDREIADIFKVNPKRYAIQPGVALSDIVIDPKDNGAKYDAKGDAQAEQRARDLKTRLNNGDDFATLARQYSEHQSAYQSGDIGFLPTSEFADALPQQMGLPASVGDRLYKMEPGNVTEPIKDAAGRWHILKITGKQTETRERPLDDPNVRKEIQDAILAQRKQVLDAAIQARARDEAKIENFLARRMLDNPNSFGVLRPVPAANTGAASPSPTAEAQK